MPEGDTVWRTALHLDRALSGRTLVSSDFRVPAYATVDLSGRVVDSTVARGKHLLTRFGQGAESVTLHTHLKMEGAWHLYRDGHVWRRPAHEARVVLSTDEWTAVGFALGVVEVLPRTAEATLLAHLGPDLLGPDWDLDEAVRRVAANPDRAVGEAILDQRNVAGAGDRLSATGGRTVGEALLDQTAVAGIGNLYKCEALFLAGVSPFTPAAEVRDLPKLLNLARRLMLANLREPMQVTTGVARRGRQHWVYRRGGLPCRRCGTPIRSASQGKVLRERVTYWCPACQPGQATA